MNADFGFLFNILPILITVVFVLVFVVIFVSVFFGIRAGRRNQHAPQLTVPATVVSKRMDVSQRYHDHNHGYDNVRMQTLSTTTYYVTFQVESGDRLELYVPSSEYGYLVEGDQGQLHFQGTQFLGFDRK